MAATASASRSRCIRNYRTILLTAQASGLVRERKGVRFADAEALPLVHIVTIETRTEQEATPVETLTEEEMKQGVVAKPISIRGRYYGEGSWYDPADRDEPEYRLMTGNEARRSSFDVRRLLLQYCRDELEMQIFDEAVENVLSENNDSMIGARPDDGK